jgi:uncharacterized membrane protein
MNPAAVVAALSLLFVGSHIGLAALRARIVARCGELGFAVLFSAVASMTFAALVTYYAGHRFDGGPGLGLGAVAGVRWALMGAVVCGFASCAAALASYARFPTALFAQPVQRARGIERVTRHPFFAGAALFALAHALLAPHLIGTILFGGLALLAIVGASHQDRKLLERRGPAFAAYLRETSAVPFKAIIEGRQTFAWRELPVRALGVGVAFALAARHWHDSLFAGGGWWIVGATLGGAAIAGISAWRRSQRLARREPARPMDLLPSSR